MDNERSLAKEITEGFEALKSMRNNEPVAWTACLDCGKRVTGDSIHTCSPQLKELTDEEIRTIQAICHLKDVGYNTFIMRFARAILRKSQEK
jgi:hypothetical protein